jgi:hypothetical protein
LLDIILGSESAECGLAVPIPIQLLVILRRCVVKVVINAQIICIMQCTSFFVDSLGEKKISVKKLLFVVMVIINVRLSKIGREHV